MPPLDNPSYCYNNDSASDDIYSDEEVLNDDETSIGATPPSANGGDETSNIGSNDVKSTDAIKITQDHLDKDQLDKYYSDDMSSDESLSEESEKYDALANIIFPIHNSGPRNIYQTTPIELGKKSWTFTAPSEESSSRLKTITLDTNGIHMDNIRRYTRGATRSLKQCIYCYYWHVSNMIYNMEGDNICYHCSIFFGLSIAHDNKFTVDDYINLCVCDHDETTCKKGEMCKLCENIQKKYDYQKEMKEKLLEKSYDFVIEI